MPLKCTKCGARVRKRMVGGKCKCLLCKRCASEDEFQCLKCLPLTEVAGVDEKVRELEEPLNANAASTSKCSLNHAASLTKESAPIMYDRMALRFLQRLKQGQQNLAPRSRAKARANRKYVVGIYEALKSVRACQAKLIIIAKDATETAKSAMFALFYESDLKNVPIIRAADKRSIGQLLTSGRYLSCICVVDCNGLEREVELLLKDAKTTEATNADVKHDEAK
ncbi:unnamed protein product, partial [Mesorhabditis spiculigera]